jgi:glycerophosphoryl diester phosphodiesterase
MTGEKGYIYDRTLAEIKALRLLDSDQQIPTFDEILSIAKGKSPLLIEIKPQPNAKVVDELVAKLKNYQGEFAIQSFNPLYINRVKKLAPEFIRGILSTADKTIKENFIKKFIVKNMSLNFIIKPDFISYSFSDLPIKNKRNLPVLAWTVTDEKTREKLKGIADNIIFENFIPN